MGRYQNTTLVEAVPGELEVLNILDIEIFNS